MLDVLAPSHLCERGLPVRGVYMLAMHNVAHSIG